VSDRWKTSHVADHSMINCKLGAAVACLRSVI
jgi:hypothetical protein